MRFLLLFALMVTVGLLSAPTVSAKQNTMALKAGLNLARPWCANKYESAFYYGDVGMKPGMIAGAALEIKRNKIFSLQPEVLFSMKGIIVSQVNTTAYTLSYLELPLLFRVNIPVNGAKPNLYAGPALALRAGVGGYYRYDDERSDFSSTRKKSLEESTNAVDFGITMGGGLEFPTGFGSILLDIRYTLGLVNIFRLTDWMRIEGGDSENMPKDKNGVLSIMVGYALEGMGKKQ